MTSTPDQRRSVLSSCLYAVLVLINIAMIAWVLFMAELGSAIREAVSYEDYREFVSHGVIDAEALGALRGKDYADNLLIFTTDDVCLIRQQILWTSRCVVLILLLDVVAMFCWRRNRKSA